MKTQTNQSMPVMDKSQENDFGVMPNSDMALEYINAAKLRNNQDLFVKIYTLSDPRTGETRYVGIQPPISQSRQEGTLAMAFSDGQQILDPSIENNGAWQFATRARLSWIRELSSLGMAPISELIDKVPISEGLKCQRDWIMQFMENGSNLLNRASDITEQVSNNALANQMPQYITETSRMKHGVYVSLPDETVENMIHNARVASVAMRKDIDISELAERCLRANFDPPITSQAEEAQHKNTIGLFGTSVSSNLNTKPMPEKTLYDGIKASTTESPIKATARKPRTNAGKNALNVPIKSADKPNRSASPSKIGTTEVKTPRGAGRPSKMDGGTSQVKASGDITEVKSNGTRQKVYSNGKREQNADAPTTSMIQNTEPVMPSAELEPVS
jgi:hypothetical protein